MCQRKILWIVESICEQLSIALPKFSASGGWWREFKKRYDLSRYQVSGEKMSADSAAVPPFIDELKEIIETGNYHPSQIYNLDETALFWKLLLSSTFASKQSAKVLRGVKQCKNRVTLLFTSNASGDHKLKPLLIHTVKTPTCGFPKPNAPTRQKFMDELGVIFKDQQKGWMTVEIFEKWLIENFLPEVEQFHNENHPDLEFKVLLTLDNAPVHKTRILEAFDDKVKLVFSLPTLRA